MDKIKLTVNINQHRSMIDLAYLIAFIYDALL